MQLNENIKRLIIDVCGRITYLTVIFFFFTLWLYTYNDIEQALKEAWAVSTSFLGVLATLGAAIIAANLFNDWKNQHNKTVEKEMGWVVIQKFDAAKFRFSRFEVDFQNFKYKCNFPLEMQDDELQNLDKELNSILSSIKGGSLELFAFWDSVKNYSLITEKTYFESITNDIRRIEALLFNIQNHRAIFPKSMNAIQTAIRLFNQDIINIETKCINEILKELKALK